MAIPKRQLIREAIKNLLLNETLCGENVFSNRVSAYWKSELPSISIFMRDEALTPRDMANKNYIRKASVLIEIHAQANEELDNTLDEINESVEAILLADSSLAGTVQGLVFTDLEFEIANDASVDVGVLTLTAQVTYTK